MAEIPIKIHQDMANFGITCFLKNLFLLNGDAKPKYRVARYLKPPWDRAFCFCQKTNDCIFILCHLL